MCSLHFRKADYTYGENPTYSRLVGSAIPSLNLPSEAYLEEQAGSTEELEPTQLVEVTMGRPKEDNDNSNTNQDQSSSQDALMNPVNGPDEEDPCRDTNSPPASPHAKKWRSDEMAFDENAFKYINRTNLATASEQSSEGKACSEDSNVEIEVDPTYVIVGDRHPIRLKPISTLVNENGLNVESVEQEQLKIAENSSNTVEPERTNRSPMIQMEVSGESKVAEASEESKRKAIFQNMTPNRRREWLRYLHYKRHMEESKTPLLNFNMLQNFSQNAISRPNGPTPAASTPDITSRSSEVDKNRTAPHGRPALAVQQRILKMQQSQSAQLPNLLKSVQFQGPKLATANVSLPPALPEQASSSQSGLPVHSLPSIIQGGPPHYVQAYSRQAMQSLGQYSAPRLTPSVINQGEKPEPNGRVSFFQGPSTSGNLEMRPKPDQNRDDRNQQTSQSSASSADMKLNEDRRTNSPRRSRDLYAMWLRQEERRNSGDSGLPMSHELSDTSIDSDIEFQLNYISTSLDGRGPPTGLSQRLPRLLSRKRTRALEMKIRRLEAKIKKYKAWIELLIKERKHYLDMKLS